MKPGAGSVKGADYERKICRALALWWTDGQRDDVFWRTSNSGGRATTRLKKGKGTYGQIGDVAALDPIGEPLLKVFTFEIKTGYVHAHIGDLIVRPGGGTIGGWLKKIRRQHEHTRRSLLWALIFKRGRQRPLIIYPTDLHARFGVRDNDFGLTMTVFLPWVTLAVVPLDDFLTSVRPDDIRRCAVDWCGPPLPPPPPPNVSAF